MVELVVKVAQLSDPHSLAARQGSTSDITAARAARSRAYQHLLGVLKPLVTGTPTLAAPVGAAAAAAGSSGGGAGTPASGTALTAGETKAAKEAIIQVGGCADREHAVTEGRKQCCSGCRAEHASVCGRTVSNVFRHLAWPHPIPLITPTPLCCVATPPLPPRPSCPARTSTSSPCCTRCWSTCAQTQTCSRTTGRGWVSGTKGEVRSRTACCLAAHPSSRVFCWRGAGESPSRMPYKACQSHLPLPGPLLPNAPQRCTCCVKAACQARLALVWEGVPGCLSSPSGPCRQDKSGTCSCWHGYRRRSASESEAGAVTCTLSDSPGTVHRCVPTSAPPHPTSGQGSISWCSLSRPPSPSVAHCITCAPLPHPPPQVQCCCGRVQRARDAPVWPRRQHGHAGGAAAGIPGRTHAGAAAWEWRAGGGGAWLAACCIHADSKTYPWQGLQLT